MKNLFKLFVPVAAAAIALVSCQPKEEQIGNNPAGEVTIRVHATADNLKAGDQETKTYIDNTNTIIWGTGEYMKLALTAGEKTTFATSTDASADTFDGDTEAMFEFSVTPETASEYVYQGLYPASAAATSDNTNAANYKVNLPAIQNATASSYDPAAYIMVAKPETFSSVQTDWEASYRRGTALNKITLKNVPDGVSFNKVKITAEGKKLAGGRHFNLTTGEGLEVYGTDATIEVLYATAISGANVDVWFTSWDTEIAAGEKLTIIAYTTDNKSYTKEITARTGGIKFQEGYLNTLGASLSGITPENVSTFAAGDYVILAKNGSTYYALKGEVSGTRIASVDYSGSLTNYNGDASLVWTIAASGTGYTIKNGGNFVGWTSGNAADLIAEADYDATKCLMGIAENGDDTYKIYVLADASRMLARNTSNPYFAFYGGTQYKDLVLVPATAMEQVATPSFDPAAGAVASGTTVTISCATSGATIHYTDDGSEPTSSSATYSSPITITATTTIKAIAVKTDMADSEIATATYTVGGSTTDYSTTYTTGSDVTVTVDSGNASSHVSISNTSYDAVKANKAATFTITVPSGTTTVHLFIAAWNGEGHTVTVSGGTMDNTTIVADSGISGSSTTYTLNGTVSDYYRTIDVDANTTEITIACAANKRAVIWGVNAEAGTPVTPTVATPTFSFIPSGNKVSISCATDGATIYYTTDGSDPTTSSNVYSEAISISGSQTTIKAFATKSSYDDSAIASTTYYAINRAATTNGSISAVDYAAEGDEITITVTPDSGYTLETLSVTDSSDNAVAVASNKFTMPTSPVTVSATFALIPVTTIADALGAPGTYEVPNVAVYAVKGSALILGDASGKIYAYSSGHNLNVGDVRTVSGSTKWYNNGDVYEFDAPTFSGSGTTSVNHGTALEFASVAATLKTETGFASPGSGAAHTAVYVHAIGSQSGRNITTSNGEKLYLSANENDTDGKTVEVYGYVYAYSASHSNFNFLVTSIEEDTTTPTLSVSTSALNWAATETDSKSITVTLNGSAAAGDYTYSVTSGTASNWTIIKNNGTLTVAPNAANTDTENAKSITIRIVHADDTDVYQDVTCTQAKASGGSGGGTVTVWDDDFSQFTSASTTALTSLTGSKTGFTSSYSGVSTVYPEESAIKFASSKKAGSITTPAFSALTSTSTVTVTIQAAGMNAKTGPLTFTVNNAGTASSSSATVSASGQANASGVTSWDTISFTITGATSATTLTISAASGKQVFINSINIVTSN